MSSYIEDLYFGELTPQAGIYDKHKDIRNALEKADETEKYLLENLKGDLLEKFKTHIDATEDFYGLSAVYSYKKGFRDGARLTNDIFSND